MDCGVRIATFQNMKAPGDIIEKMFDNVSFSLDKVTAQKVRRDTPTLNFSEIAPISNLRNSSTVSITSMRSANLKVASCGEC